MSEARRLVEKEAVGGVPDADTWWWKVNRPTFTVEISYSRVQLGGPPGWRFTLQWKDPRAPENVRVARKGGFTSKEVAKRAAEARADEEVKVITGYERYEYTP